MNLRRLAAASVSLLLAAAPAIADAQEVSTRVPLVGPYVSGSLGFHDPTGADYPSDVGGGAAIQLTAGWRVAQALSLEASWYGAGITDRDGTGTIDAVGLDARIYPFLFYGARGREYRPWVEPNFLIGVTPFSSLYTGAGSHFSDGYGLDLGAGLRWRTRSPFYFTADIRWMGLRYPTVDGSQVIPAFRGDDVAFTVGLGWQFPVIVLRP